MEHFVIVCRTRYGEPTKALLEVTGESRARAAADAVYYKGSMQMCAVVDETPRVVYKIERRCHCTNVQREWDSSLESTVLKCVDCGRVIDHNAWKGEVCKVLNLSQV